MERRDFLRGLGKASAATGAAIIAAKTVEVVVAPPAPQVVTVEKIVEKQVPIDTVTLQQFEDATYAYERGYITSGAYHKIADDFTRTTVVAQAAEAAKHPDIQESPNAIGQRRFARRDARLKEKYGA